MTTRLQAINRMLTGVGQSPVTSLDASNPELASAELILDAASAEIQGEGWHFNSEVAYPFLADNDGYISIPSNVLSLSDNKTENQQQYQTVIRDGRLYDKVNHTYDFGAGTTVKCDVVWLFDFVDLPQPFKEYIINRATRQFAGRYLGSNENVQFIGQDEIVLRANCLSYDTNTSGVNVFGYENGQTAYISYAPYRAIQR